ncbi:MAG TPA: hypothetical protein VMC85_20315 [Desulfomonilaceae bacterium]|nr:hypothetical protein [Desulfomonilaceae bacterium]
MSMLTDKLENWLSAVAFAEAGEHETAIAMVGISPMKAKSRAGLLETLNKYFSAGAFAEEDCRETALEILDAGAKKNSFLEKVGLTNVKVWYGTLPSEQASFLEEIGLTGVRVRFATLTV